MTDSRWDQALERIREEYHAPPETPREEMWGAIEQTLVGAELDGQAGGGDAPDREVRRTLGRPGPLSFVAAAAAVALLWAGFGLGRASVQTPATARTAEAEPGPGIVQGSPASGDAATLTATGPASAGAPVNAYGFAAARLLSTTGTFLTQVEDRAAQGTMPDNAGRWAKGLLTQTRLMLDAPAGDEAGLRTLLEDLELILMQVVALSQAQDDGDSDVGGFELEQLTNGLRNGDVLPRIQRMLPPMRATDE